MGKAEKIVEELVTKVERGEIRLQKIRRRYVCKKFVSAICWIQSINDRCNYDCRARTADGDCTLISAEYTTT